MEAATDLNLDALAGINLSLDAEAKIAAAPQKLYKGKPEYAPPYYTINVQHVEHMPEYEVIGVNGEVIQVTRGVDVPNIPQAFMNVLKHAIAGKQFTVKQPDSTEVHEWRNVSAIPYSIVEGPYLERK